MRKVLKQAFFQRPVLEVAPELLGKYLVHNDGQRETALMITETEAYDGEHDLACHAAKGRTARTEVMFGEAGVWYVYLVYGMHEMLNIVTSEPDYPAAVLIRAVAGQAGPGKLTKALNIDRRYNGHRAKKSTGLWLEDRGVVVELRQIAKAPRIGVDYAGKWAKKPWRFTLEK